MKAIVTFTCYYRYDVEGEDERACLDEAFKMYRSDKVSVIGDTGYNEVDLKVYQMEWDDEDEE